MKATTKALIAAAVAVVAAVMLIFWQARHHSGGYAPLTSLSSEDLSLLAEGFSPMERMKLSSSPEERKKLAEDIRQLLAVANEAHEKGYTDRPEVKRQLEMMRTIVIAQTYGRKQRDAKAEGWMPKPEEIEAFSKNPENMKQVEEYMEDVKKLGLVPEGQEITEELKSRFRQQWAPMALLAQKARAAGIEKERQTQLQIQFQQAVALDNIYESDLAKKLTPNDQEIQEYFAQHPELDPKAAHDKAEALRQRAASGEDFDKLAKENSDEPGAKDSGGDLGWFGRGRMVKPFEEAAFALKDNEISQVVESPFGFHVIQVLGRRTGKTEANPMTGAKGGEDEEQIHARHILIKTGAANANPFGGPPKSPRDTAKEAILAEKRKKIVEEIAERSKSKVTVPEDFTVKAPEVPPNMGMPPGMGGAPPDDDHALPGGEEGGDSDAPKKSSGGAKPKAAPPAKKK